MAAMFAVGAGCTSDESMASPSSQNATMQAAPSFADVNHALKLNESDAAVVKQALAEWQRGARAATTGAPGFAARRQEMEFIATVTPSLDDAQLTSLVSLLTSRHETHRDEMRAQHAGNRNGDAMKKMARELGLSDKQRDQLKALHADTRTKAEAQRESLRKGAITEDQMHTALETIHKDARTQMETILTADQVKKLDAMRDDRFENRMGRRVENSDKREDAHLAWMVRTLQLSDMQASAVKTAMATLGDAQESSFKAVQAGSLSRDQVQDQMRAAHDAFAEKLKGILTADQLQRLDILKPLLPGRIHHA
jgi:hypothetical protein